MGLDKLDPTPENYARAYQQEAGGPLPPAAQPAAPTPEQTAEQAAEQATALAKLIERIVRGVQQGGRQWTSARKKESLQRVLSGSRSDTGRLQQRLGQLLSSWESDRPDETVETDAAPLDEPQAQPAAADADAPALERIRVDTGEATPPTAQRLAAGPLPSPHWGQALACLHTTVQEALPPPPAPAELADELAALMRAVPAEGPTAEQLALLNLFYFAHERKQVVHDVFLLISTSFYYITP